MRSLENETAPSLGESERAEGTTQDVILNNSDEVVKHYGATPSDWDYFSLVLGLTADLLPVASDPSAKISAGSTLKAAGKVPSRYNSQGEIYGLKDWTSNSSTQERVNGWATDNRLGICLQTRNVRALDIDVTDAEEAKSISDFIAKRYELPRRTRSNSSKFLLAFHLKGEYTKRKFTTKHGIVEFLATGQHAVVAGTHPSGARYEWNGLPNFPTLSAEAFEDLWAALVAEFAVEDSVESAPSVRKEKQAAALNSDPVARYLLDKNTVLKVEKDGRMHVQCPFKDEHTSESSESSTTYFPAHTNGYSQGHWSCLHAHCQGRDDSEFNTAIGYSEADDFEVLTTIEEDGTKAREKDRFEFVPAHIFAESAAPSWLIKSVLPRAGVGVVYGPSGSGKTFQVLDMAFSIARGVDWRGHRVKRGRIAYIAAEGAGGVRTRLKAYALHHNIPLSEVPILLLGAAPNFIEKTDAVDVAKAVLHSGAALLIVDTLAQVMPGGDENSGKDMGRLIEHCNGIHKATGAMVLLIHHPGKNEDRGARGWSGLRGALDVEFRVESESGAINVRRSMTITKMKDAEEGAEFGFSLRSVVVGVDEDGEDITSCVVEHSDVVPKAQRKKEPKGSIERTVVRVFSDLTSLCAGGIQDLVLLNAVVDQLPAEEGARDRRREKVLRACEGLVASGRLVKNNGLFVEG